MKNKIRFLIFLLFTSAAIISANPLDKEITMNTKGEALKQYLKFLELGDYTAIMSLFASDAVVISPLYGHIQASKFYKDLFSVTTSSKLTLKNIFEAENHTAALHFEYLWTMKDGQRVTFEVVDVFDFDSENKIKKLTIIYDTYTVRPEFEKNKSQS